MRSPTAVIAGEPERTELVERTRGTSLIAPASVHWEIGNALAAMMKRRRATLDRALADAARAAGVDVMEVSP